MAAWQALLIPMTAGVKFQINMIEEEHHMAQRLQQLFLETTCQPPLEKPAAEAVVLTRSTRKPSKTDSDEERRPRRKRRTECHNRRSHGSAITFP